MRPPNRHQHHEPGVPPADIQQPPRNPTRTSKELTQNRSRLNGMMAVLHEARQQDRLRRSRKHGPSTHANERCKLKSSARTPIVQSTAGRWDEDSIRGHRETSSDMPTSHREKCFPICHLDTGATIGLDHTYLLKHTWGRSLAH